MIYGKIWKVRKLVLPEANMDTSNVWTFDASWLSDLGFANSPLIFCEPLCLQQWNLWTPRAIPAATLHPNTPTAGNPDVSCNTTWFSCTGQRPRLKPSLPNPSQGSLGTGQGQGYGSSTSTLKITPRTVKKIIQHCICQLKLNTLRVVKAKSQGAVSSGSSHSKLDQLHGDPANQIGAEGYTERPRFRSTRQWPQRWPWELAVGRKPWSLVKSELKV